MDYFIDLKGKKVVIAGASQGIGKETAILLNKLGADVILLARNEAKLNEVLASLRDGGNGSTCYAIDLGDTESIESIVKTIVKEQGSIDGIVYCAGINNDRPLSMFKPKVVEEVLRVNLCGFIELVRCFTKRGRFNDGMRIVGISSTAGLKGSRAHLAYSSSKAGMDNAVKCMAIELAEKGICANTVAPGMIRTEMYNKYLKDNGGENSSANLGLLGRQYLGIGEPRDVANAIAFLISPAARFITGVCLPVDGGLTSN